MKIAKEYSWEMGHRLPEHFGKCKNIHGHSYKMLVELEGDLNEEGMILDYYDLNKIVQPLIDKLDHAFLVYEKDADVIEFLNKINSKKMVVGFQSTVENICLYILSEIKKINFPINVKNVKVRVQETPGDYAEDSLSLC